MTHRLTVIVVVMLGLLAAVQVQAEAQVAGPALQRVSLARRYLEFSGGQIGARRSPSASPGPQLGTGTLSPVARTIGVLPSVRVGDGPQGAAFDRATDTVYVTNQNDNTVSVVDARHCNSLDTSGCAQTPATVATGGGPFAIAIDDVTHTAYVANQNDDTLSVIDTATCNGRVSSGCAHAGPTVAAGPTPFGIAVDRRTDTVYVADVGGDSGTVSVINGATCNAVTTAGCGQRPANATVGQFPFGLLIDRRDHTVYVTNAIDDTVSMIDRRTCKAANTAGCARAHPTVAVGSFPIGLALDRRTGSLYVGSQNFADASSSAPGNGPTIVVINAHTCNARQTGGCAGRHPTLTIPGGTDGMSFDQRTETLLRPTTGPARARPSAGACQSSTPRRATPTQPSAAGRRLPPL